MCVCVNAWGVHARVCVCERAYVHGHMCVCVNAWGIHACVCVCVRAYVHMHSTEKRTWDLRLPTL